MSFHVVLPNVVFGFVCCSVLIYVYSVLFHLCCAMLFYVVLCYCMLFLVIERFSVILCCLTCTSIYDIYCFVLFYVVSMLCCSMLLYVTVYRSVLF